MKRPIGATRLAACLLAALLWAGAAGAADLEQRAHDSFTAGRYAESLELYGRLYRDTGHPTYLRNVGRCYQMLKDPEHAIASFQEYLRISNSLTDSARAEIEGFIEQMEDLRARRRQERKQDSKPAAAPPASPTRIAATAPSPGAENRGASFQDPDVARPRPARDDSGHPLLWVAGGALVAAAVTVAAVFLLRPGPSSPCPECMLPTVRVDTR